MKKAKDNDFVDELSSTFTHGIGGYLGAAALVLLIVFAIRSGTQVPWKIVGGTIFASAVILLYTISSVYHAVTNARLQRILQVCDHMAIYVLIAGTYTPFCLVTLRQDHPAIAWTVFGIAWGLTLLGIVFKLFSTGKLKYVSTGLYLAMGWMALPISKPLYDSLALAGTVWLVLGGVLYTVGTVFYLWCITPIPHTIWHLFVLAGTTCHFFCILFYVMQ